MDQQASRFTPGIWLPRHAPLTIIDRTTGLEWTARPVGGKRMTHQEAIDACAALDLDGQRNWHLPTLQELESLRDITRFDPCIDTDVFPDFPSSWFWTSDPAKWSEQEDGSFSAAWGVGFYNGLVDGYPRGSNGFALACRRAGQ
ncbi:Lcl C-terminal domain-containing protein [Marilutibacter alkalisoli]|uniref:DUF1566 domain-containing protein n=1 Tax=Marilutibacter alkalisoli TaxID=2591633 RepID=A0A514BTY3_9GAMM|nr:DUF1566 domain-containing protein [Lysobacter alkalisoli]QDH70868.1 DUF1566 domain-containing protein [Lysobacter alkalisoli]